MNITIQDVIKTLTDDHPTLKSYTLPIAALDASINKKGIVTLSFKSKFDAEGENLEKVISGSFILISVQEKTPEEIEAANSQKQENEEENHG